MKAMTLLVSLLALQWSAHADFNRGDRGGPPDRGDFDRGDHGDRGDRGDHGGPGWGDHGDHRGGPGWGHPGRPGPGYPPGRPGYPPPPPAYPPYPPPPPTYPAPYPPPPPAYPPAPTVGSSPSNAYGFGPIVCEIVNSKSNASYYGRGNTNDEAAGNAKYVCNSDPNPFGPLCNKYGYTQNFFYSPQSGGYPAPVADGKSPVTAIGAGPVLCVVVQQKNNQSYYGRGNSAPEATANAKVACNNEPNPFGPLCNMYAWTATCY